MNRPSNLDGWIDMDVMGNDTYTAKGNVTWFPAILV